MPHNLIRDLMPFRTHREWKLVYDALDAIHNSLDVLSGNALSDADPRETALVASPGISTDVSRADHTHAIHFDLPTFNVLDFGAVGDDSANDTAAIQAAIDAAAANGGGVVIIPANRVFRISQIVLKGRVDLIGVSRRSTLKSVDTSPNNVMIINDASAFWCRVSNLLIDGNKANQASFHQGIHLFDEDKGQFILENLIIQNCRNDAIEIENGSNFLINNWIIDNGGNGIILRGPDNSVIGQHIGHCGENGIQIFHASNWIAATKVFQSGWGAGGLGTGTGPGDGVQILFGGNRIEGMDLQHNARHGIYIAPTANNYGGMIDAQFDGAPGGPGSCVALDGAKYWKIRGHAVNVEGPWDHIVNFLDTDCVENDIDISYVVDEFQDALTPGNAPVFGMTGLSQLNNINIGPRAVNIAAAAAAYTPDPYRYTRHILGLTENLTVNAPAHQHIGQRLHFIFYQDGSGGLTVTWNAIFKTNWTPNTGAGITNVIDFLYDGTNWVQIGGVTGL